MSLQDLDNLTNRLKSNEIISDVEMKNIGNSLDEMKKYISFLKDRVNNPDKTELNIVQINDTNINDMIKEINELYGLMERTDKPIEESVDIFIRLSQLCDKCSNYLKETKKVEPIYLA